MNSRDVIRALEQDGRCEVKQRGNHKQFKHATKRGRVTVPLPRRDRHYASTSRHESARLKKSTGWQIRPA